ncbi:uncharacterized protein [Euwallacea fornicatus]|uniref:uncharacterized protein n=1 Tax=Euwallacea fornicatus TaxID=995702 RepID=UPI00338DDFC8
MKFLVLLSVVALSWSSARSDPCEPGKIDDITLEGATEISWVSNPNGCSVEEFLIDIIDSEGGVNLAYHDNETKLKVDLELCKKYTFDIRAITTEHVSGPSNKMDLTTRLTSGDNVGVAFTGITSSTSGVTFNWDLLDQSVTRCITGYKVVYWNENDSPVNTEVTTPSFTIKPTESCMNYTVIVNAEVNEAKITPPSIQGSIRAIATSPPDIPSLTKENILPESAEFLFTVQAYLDYRCSFTLVVRITGPGLDEKYTLDVVDNAQRNRVLPIDVDNLTPNSVYDGLAWTVNDVGESQQLAFQFTTPNK